MRNFLPSALPWQGFLAYPVLLVLICVLLFSTATMAFFIKQTLSFTKLRLFFDKHPGAIGSLLAALLGAATPFCTCTAMPLFLGMLEADVPLGPSVSFLLASPTINLGAVILLFIVFGWHIALFYIGACLIASVAIGWMFGRIPRDKALHQYLWLDEEEGESGKVAFRKAVRLGGQLTRKFLPWLALATLAGIVLDWLVPTSAVAVLSHWSVFIAIPLAVILGSIIYADILFLIPIGFALIQHGATVSVFLYLCWLLPDSAFRR